VKNDIKLIQLIKQNLSDDLRKPKYKGNPNRMKGHCYVASEVFYHLAQNPSEWLPGSLPHEGDVHWVLKNRHTREVLDITVEQFKTKPDYARFRGRGFLTKGPSKRAKKLIERITEKTK